MTLRCFKWKENDDPWKEQKKNIGWGEHPLGILRKFVPRANDYEIIRKPTVIFELGFIDKLSKFIKRGASF